MSREKILNAAIELVAENGTDVSVRQISKKAGVNVAAISYHFGSKDNLINEIVMHKMQVFKEVFDLLDDQSIEPIARLEKFMCKLVSIVNQNYEFLDHILSQKELFKSRYEYQFFLKDIGYDKLVSVIRQITCVDDEKELTTIIEYTLSFCLLGYIGERISKNHENFQNDIDFEYRVKIFIEHFFNRYVKKEQ